MSTPELKSSSDINPYPFTESDLQRDRLMHGVRYTLERFYTWRDNNPDLIGKYINRCQEQLEIIRHEHSFRSRIGRTIIPFARRTFEERRLEREISIFSIRNMAEVPAAEAISRFRKLSSRARRIHKRRFEHDKKNLLGGEHALSFLGSYSESTEIETRWRRLYGILPEQVIQDGAMGKVARTMLGIRVIAALDMQHAVPAEQKAHLMRVMPMAYIFGAAYAIIDDTLQDLNGDFFSDQDRTKYHDIILQGLRTGTPIDTTDLPDHPLSEEMNTLFEWFRQYFPIEKYPHLYQAAESLYLSQHHELRESIETTDATDLRNLYPNIMIKSAMTRVIANLLARKTVDPDFYRRCINSMIVHQLRDDCVDFLEDRHAKRVTPFTVSNIQDGNPLYDIFAYDAYIAQTLYPGAESLLAYSHAVFFSYYLSIRVERSEEILRKFGDTIPLPLRKFITDASRFSRSIIRDITPVDHKVRDAINSRMKSRDQTAVDPQTFVLDRIEFINSVLQEFIENHKRGDSAYEFYEIIRYAIDAGGKRLRPALTLMLAEGLDVDPDTIRPLLIASELFHTSSLLLDDLPWQDNSMTRRGKPTAHTIYGASTVELAGIYMLLEGVEVLQELQKHYPPDYVIALTSYTMGVIQDICHGQNMDLHMKKEEASLDAILLMYHLKTSVAIEASLVPLMILQKRPQKEIVYIQEFAHHAGLVFQIRDDLLDAQSRAEILGKDTNHDTGKINLVQMFGQDKAIELMEYHLEQALNACKNLQFNTDLLQSTVKYFAKRKR